MPKSKYSAGLEGLRFGRWIVLRFSHTQTEPREEGLTRTIYFWLCHCECGNERAVNARLLFRGKSKSCGCYNKEQTAKRHTTHGLLVGVHRAGKPRGKATGEYRSWDHMIQRCTNPKHGKYWHRYGGRGIKVCVGFRNSFIHFLNTVGHKPTPQYSIDRTNNNGNYSCGDCPECADNGWPLNCRWATKLEQTRNRSPRQRAA